MICPECGQDVTASKTTPRIRDPDLDDRELREQIDELLTYGWLCTRHEYDVVIPVECQGQKASNLQDGWIGVRLVFADDTVRWVPTPQKEIHSGRADD